MYYTTMHMGYCLNCMTVWLKHSLMVCKIMICIMVSIKFNFLFARRVIPYVHLKVHGFFYGFSSHKNIIHMQI